MTVFQKVYKTLLFLFLFFLLTLFACFPARYMQVFSEGISLWAICVLPSALPFLFLTGLMTRTGGVNRLSRLLSPATSVLFGFSGVGAYCTAMSFLSGYPVGAKLLSDLHGQGVITSSEGTKMSILCSSSGPLFVLGSVGAGMFRSARIGGILLGCHYAAILSIGLIFRFLPTEKSEQRLPTLSAQTENFLHDTMLSSVISVLCVGGFIAVFYTLSAIADDWGLIAPLSESFILLGMPAELAEGFARGLIEMTGGCKTLCATHSPLSVALCEFLITFGGLSILVQQTGYLRKAGVRLTVFLPAKLLQAGVGGVFAYFLTLITA